MMLQVNGIQRKASIAILIPDKIDFKTKMVTNDKDGHFMIIEGTLHQEDITFIIYTYVHNLDALKFIK